MNSRTARRSPVIEKNKTELVDFFFKAKGRLGGCLRKNTKKVSEEKFIQYEVKFVNRQIGINLALKFYPLRHKLMLHLSQIRLMKNINFESDINAPTPPRTPYGD